MPIDFSIFNGKKIFVTGSTGFKGSWLCTWLADVGAEVTGYALRPLPDAPLFDQLTLPKRIHQVYADVRDGDAFTKAMQVANPEIVIHMAAQPLVRLSYKDPKTTVDTNVGGGLNLLEAVRYTPSVKSVVFISSDKCYFNKEWDWGYRENDQLGGKDPYSASKAAAEMIFETYSESFFKARDNFGAATVRAGNVIGGGDFSVDRIIPDCIRALKEENPIILRNPNSTRPWQHVLEPLSGYLTVAKRLLESPKDYKGAWNFGPNVENVKTVEELAKRSIGTWGAGSLVIEEDPNSHHEANLLMLSSDKAKSKLQWEPRWNFDQAVDKTISWYRDVHDGFNPLDVTRKHIQEYCES